MISEGIVSTVATGFKFPTALVVNDNVLYVTDSLANRIKKIKIGL